MTPIPFEPQRTIDGSRTCAAAALTMVYRSLGCDCEPLDVWSRVAEEIGSGVKAARTHRIARDACRQGLSAVTLQAERPAELLLHLLATDARVILNHRLDRQSHLGHYSVLVGFDGEEIEIHDPYRGPNRVLPWPEFAGLWNPAAERSEIVGRVLVAIGHPPGESGICPECGGALPPHLTCGRCAHAVPTGPAGVTRCTASGCRGRLWNRLFCPECDWAENRVRPRC